MVNLPAVCKNCGCTFGSGIVVENCSNSSFIGNKAKCPKCGHMADILDATTDSQGNLHFSKSAFKVLNSPAVDSTTLEKLKTIIAKQQKTEKPHKENLIQSIRDETPEISELAELLTPTNAGEFYGLLSFLIALIIFIQTMRNSSKEPAPVIINNFNGAGCSEETIYNAGYQAGALRRKSPCPCGSGKKYKNCHGG